MLNKVLWSEVHGLVLCKVSSKDYITETDLSGLLRVSEL